MEFGIDLGTTRTVVAAGDNGNHPVVAFTNEVGDMVDFIPTMSAVVENKLVHGHAAAQAADEGHPYLLSWKRLLGQHGPNHRVQIGATTISLLELTTDFLRHLRQALREQSTFSPALDAAPRVVISVPANAHSSQRFTTLEAFRLAGFDVLAMVNEPSAAGIEYAHRHGRSLNSQRDRVAVYDLGGGTFDAALVEVGGKQHKVLQSAGVQRLGGDDFDEVLLRLALEQHALELEQLSSHDRFVLLQAARRAKESIRPNTRRVVLDCEGLSSQPSLAGEALLVTVKSYYERLGPLLDRSLDALAQVLGASNDAPEDSLKQHATQARVAGIYLVGGGSLLPVVARRLREGFGRRVHRSPYPSAAVAIGLAIAAADRDNGRIDERLTRHVGVFRESEHGASVCFDPIFLAGTPMPQKENPLVIQRRYRACHNIGIFRFVECANVKNGQPEGDLSPHKTVLFPFAQSVREQQLEALPVERLAEPQKSWIEESYQIDSAGVIAVTIRDSSDGYAQRYTL